MFWVINLSVVVVLGHQFECCGVDAATDFDNATKWQNAKPSGQVVPPTCCKLKNRDAFFDDNEVKLDNSSCPTTALTSKLPNTDKVSTVVCCTFS